MNTRILSGGSLVALFWAGALNASAAQVAEPSDPGVPTTIAEVIVTAEKREQKLNLVPGAVSAISGGRLEALGARSLSDFAALVPGLNFQNSSGAAGSNTVVIRGITTGGEPSPLVGIVVDGVPYGSSSSFAFGGLLGLDAGLWDIDRVEVLRGPQGTLYGASAMGGLLSYVYKKPNLDHYEARAEGEVASINGGGTDYVLRGAFSAPLVTDRAAVRVAVSRQHSDGFIDNRLLGQNAVNSGNSDSVRAALLLKPSDKLTVQLSGLYQKTGRHSSDGVLFDIATGQPSGGDLEQSRSRLEPSEVEYAQGALTADYDFGPVILSSISAYQDVRMDGQIDVTRSPAGALLASLGAETSDFDIASKTRKFSQELRLTSTDAGRFKYIMGLFYVREDSKNQQALNGFLANGSPIPAFTGAQTIALPSTYEEYAAFAQGTYSLTDRLELTAGFRYSHDEQTFSQTNGGPFGGGVAIPNTSSSGTQQTYLFTARYKLDNSSSLYARAASGYRPGGPNVIMPTGGLPATFQSDTLWNYEAGYKARLWGGRADLQVSAFYIDWSNVQITATAGGYSGRANGKSASSRGIEAQGTLNPVRGLTVGGNLAYVDAHLDDAAPAIGGAAGERLPNTPRSSGAVFGDYRFPLQGDWSGVIGATVRAVGERPSSFNASIGVPPFTLKSYVVADLRAGAENERWSLTAFIRNVGDERAQYSANTQFLTTTNQALVTVARPRTIGVTLGATF